MNDHWIGLIPAAGKGIRLGLPYPKELYPIIRDNHYKPVSQFVLDNLTLAGIRHIVFVINETKNQLLGYFGNGSRFGCSLSYVVQETLDLPENSTSPGLAGAIDSAYHLTRGKTVFFGMADTIMQPQDVFLRASRNMQPDTDVLLCLFPTENPEKFGMVCVDSDNRVLEVIDKPIQTDLKEMWGCMVWREKFTELIHASLLNQIYDFAKIINLAISSGLIVRACSISEGNYIDLGTYDEIMKLDSRFRQEY